MSKKNDQPAVDPVIEDPVIEESAAPEVVTIKNIHSAPFMICGHRVMPGKSYDVTEQDAKQEKYLKRIENGIKLGCLEQV